MILIQVKKKSLYKPGQIVRIPGGWVSQISRQSAREWGKVCQPYAPAVFNSRKYSLPISVTGWVDPSFIVWPINTSWAMVIGRQQDHRLTVHHADELYAGNFTCSILIKARKHRAPTSYKETLIAVWYTHFWKCSVQLDLWAYAVTFVSVWVVYLSTYCTQLYIATASVWSISFDYDAFCRRNNCRFN